MRKLSRRPVRTSPRQERRRAGSISCECLLGSLCWSPVEPGRGACLDQQIRIDIGHDSQVEGLANLIVFALAALRATFRKDAALNEIPELQRRGGIGDADVVEEPLVVRRSR